VGWPLTATDLGRGLVAIKNRQLAVHQHGSVASSQYQLDCQLAVTGYIGVVSEPGEDGESHRLVDLVVLNHQDLGMDWSAVGLAHVFKIGSTQVR
jgi:hypothetical protein